MHVLANQVGYYVKFQIIESYQILHWGIISEAPTETIRSSFIYHIGTYLEEDLNIS